MRSLEILMFGETMGYQVDQKASAAVGPLHRELLKAGGCGLRGRNS